MPTSTLRSDTCTTDKYIINIALKKIENRILHLDNKYHKSAREWNNEEKSNLIVSILNKYLFHPIVIVEQNESCEIVIDGIQTLKACLEFQNDELRISDKAERTVIQYQKVRRRDDGKIENEIHEFDLRGKLFSDLPEELKNNFGEYNLSVDRYWCAEDDIPYHVNRYNSTNIR